MQHHRQAAVQRPAAASAALAAPLHHIRPTLPKLLASVRAAAAAASPGSSSSDGASASSSLSSPLSSSWEQPPSLRDSIARLQQHRQPPLPPQLQLQPASAPVSAGFAGLGSRSGEESDLLWAGYSALEEQLQRMHSRHDALTAQISELQGKLHAASKEQQGPPPSVWQACYFLACFLVVINLVGLLVNLHVGMFVPWWGGVAKAPASALAMKQVLAVALPVTNCGVVLIFCLQAIKAAWCCLRW